MLRCCLPLALAVALALAGLAAPAAAHEGTKKELDAFQRIKLEVRFLIDPSGGRSKFVIRGHGHYPNGTALKVSVRYILGDTSPKHPYGEPTEKPTYMLWSTVFVNDWNFELEILVRDFKMMPGEYVVTCWYFYDEQEPQAARGFRQEYVPPAERKDPCRYCKRHYQVAKVTIEDPAFRLRPEYEKVAGPLWKKQKADMMDRILDGYRDWYYQIETARAAYEALWKQVTHLGPIETDRIYSVARTRGTPEEQGEAIATETLKYLKMGFALCAQEGEKRSLPTQPYLYWRRLALGEGIPEKEDVNLSKPEGDPPGEENQLRAKPWTYNYLKPRLNVLLTEMTTYRKTQKVLLHRSTFFQIMAAAEQLKALVDAADLQIDAAQELLGAGGLYGKWLAAGGPDKKKLTDELVKVFQEKYKQPEVDGFKAGRNLEGALNELRKTLKSEVTFPIATWPMPASVAQPPQLSKDEQAEAKQKLGLTELESEMRGAAGTPKEHAHDKKEDKHK